MNEKEGENGAIDCRSGHEMGDRGYLYLLIQLSQRRCQNPCRNCFLSWRQSASAVTCDILAVNQEIQLRFAVRTDCNILKWRQL